mgnify:CR=1 FL=1
MRGRGRSSERVGGLVDPEIAERAGDLRRRLRVVVGEGVEERAARPLEGRERDGPGRGEADVAVRRAERRQDPGPPLDVEGGGEVEGGVERERVDAIEGLVDERDEAAMGEARGRAEGRGADARIGVAREHEQSGARLVFAALGGIAQRHGGGEAELPPLRVHVAQRGFERGRQGREERHALSSPCFQARSRPRRRASPPS